MTTTDPGAADSGARYDRWRQAVRASATGRTPAEVWRQIAEADARNDAERGGQ